MKGQQFAWFIGKVVRVDDPEGLNRVKVIPYDYYNDDVAGKKVEGKYTLESLLPWSTVMMPNTLASYKGTGGNHQLVIDSWVVGFFRDAPACQDAIIMGSLASMTEGTEDIPKGADEFNKIYTTASGHTLHISNKEGGESILIKHGTKPEKCSIEMTPDGNINIKGGVVSINGKPQT